MRKSRVIFLAKEPVLTYPQRDKLADILITVGQLSVAGMILPFIVPALDKTRITMLILGMAITFSSWFISILIVRRLE